MPLTVDTCPLGMDALTDVMKPATPSGSCQPGLTSGRLPRDADAALADHVPPVVLIELGADLGAGREVPVDGLRQVDASVAAATAVEGAEADGGLARRVVEEVGAVVADAAGLDAAGRQVVDAEAAAGGGRADRTAGREDAGLCGGAGGLGVGGGVVGGEADGQDQGGQEQSQALHHGCQRTSS